TALSQVFFSELHNLRKPWGSSLERDPFWASKIIRLASIAESLTPLQKRAPKAARGGLHTIRHVNLHDHGRQTGGVKYTLFAETKCHFDLDFCRDQSD